MELENTDGVVASLERGLGEVHWIAKGFYPSLRLRMALCGITSVALAEKFTENEYDVELVISNPGIPNSKGMQHVMPLVRHGGRDVLVDATYSQFMEYVGLTPGYIIFGGEDLYPKEKIRIIERGDDVAVATDLYNASRNFLENRESIAEVNWKRNVFDDVSEEEQKVLWSTIWKEENFDVFAPDEETMDAGRKLAQFLTAEHVRLVD